VSATFTLLAALPEEQRLAFAEAALREPYPELQAAALEALADPTRMNRPDVVIQHYADLLPEVRRRLFERGEVFREAAREAAHAPSEWTRRAALEVLAEVEGPSAFPALARGVNDPSPLVRDGAADLLENLGLRYYYPLVTWRMHGDARSRRFVEEHRPAVLQALGDLLRAFPAHGKRVALDIAIESDPDSYALLTDVVLARRDAPAYRPFVQALAEAVTTTGVELLFKLYLDPRPRVRDAAIEVMKLRTDPAFAALLASALSRLPAERFEALASRVKEVPWWPAVEVSPDLDPLSCARLMEFVVKSGLTGEEKGACLLAFRGSAHPEVRARVLGAFQAAGASTALEHAVGSLDDPSDDVKLAGVRAILAINPPNKERHLLPLLSSPNEELRRLVTREVSGASFEKYLRSFDRLDARTREVAARALAKIDARMLERLTDQITSLDPDRRLKALRIVDYVDAEADLRELLLELLADPDRRVRATVVKIVQLSESADGMRLLVGALADPDARVRANAIEAVEAAGDARLAPLLAPSLQDADSRARANAAKALARLGRPEGRQVLEAMLVDPAEGRRLSAVWAIGELGYEGAARALAARAVEETSPAVRAKIAETLARLSEAGGAGAP
jgi:HEAT repeat protein